MSLEALFRKLVREEVEAVLVERLGNDLNLNDAEGEEEEAPTPTTNKKTKKKKAAKKKKTKAKPKPKPPVEEEEEEEEEEGDVENVPTNHKDFMARIKSAALECSDRVAAKDASMDWLEEHYDTRKFTEIGVDDYPDVLAGVLDVITAL